MRFTARLPLVLFLLALAFFFIGAFFAAFAVFAVFAAFAAFAAFVAHLELDFVASELVYHFSDF